MKGRLDQKCGIEDLQIRRGWFDPIRTAPISKWVDRTDREINWDRGDCRQPYVEFDRFLMVERNLFAFAT